MKHIKHKNKSKAKAVEYFLPILFTVVLFLHAKYYMPFISDDALISFRYAARLLEGKGLTWTEGHPVEGYSNLLWTLLVAFLGKIGLDLIDASRIIGMSCMLAVIVILSARYLRREKHNGAALGLIFGLTYFVGVASTPVWAIGGLEQPLIAAALAGVIALYWKAAESEFKIRWAAYGTSFLLGIICITRPDGPLFTVAIVCALIIQGLLTRNRKTFGFAAIVILFPILFYGGQLIFRLSYYGELVPNTALVKLNPSGYYLITGLKYIARGIIASSPASIIALMFITIGLLDKKYRSKFIPVYIITLLWLVYLVIIGGDIFPAYRHFVPLVVVFAFTIAEGVLMMLDKIGDRRKYLKIFVVFMIGVMILTVAWQFFVPKNRKAKWERWEWNGRSLALTLKTAFYEEQPLLAVTAAGCLPYWSEFPCVDMLGLNDYYLPRNKPEDYGTGYIGHELGDADYIMGRAPDIIVFNVGSEPAFRVGEKLAADSRFNKQYAKVNIRTAYQPEYLATVWFRTESEKIGVVRQQDRFIIPAYLMNHNDSSVVFLKKDDLTVEVTEDEPASIVLSGIGEDFGVEINSDAADQIEYNTEMVDSAVRIDLITDSEKALLVKSLVITGLDSVDMPSIQLR